MKKINFRKTLFAAVLLFQLNAIAAFGQTVVKGSVKDNTGKPISGVVVTDGAHFNTTDAEGNYVLNTDPTRYPMVYISTPAAYELPSKEGVADGFYQYLDAGKSENQCDFVLTKRQKPVDEFVYIVLSDPQVRNEKQLDRFRTETVPDLKQTADSLKNFEIVGMGLGDLVWDAMNLYAPYRQAVSNLGMTMFQLMGNHDFNLLYKSITQTDHPADGYGEQNYYQSFGPANYSFNIGKVHVIAMKDIDYDGNKKYTERFTPEDLDWLRKDLSYVPKGNIVFLNVHAPVANNTVAAGGNARNANALFQLLRPYQVHIFSGHTHFYENQLPAPTIYEHNIGAACGAWWAGHVNRCGAPNGYLVVQVKGDDVKWRYKATGCSPDYQFRLYQPGEFESQKDYVVANIWDWDWTYTVNWYEDGVLKGAMQAFDDEDQDYINIGENALDIVQQSKPENREAAEKFAMDFAAGYLRARYDVNAAFAREDNERNMALVGCLTDIALYRMVLSLPSRMSWEKYEKQYSRQVEWLEAVQSSAVMLDLPTVTGPNGEEDYHNPIRTGEGVRNNYIW